MQQCRFFTGDRPCGRNLRCDSTCHSYQEVHENILLVHLGALGAVVRSTSLLWALRRRHPQSRLIWLTQSPAHKILQGHPLLDQVVTLEQAQELQAFDFDFAYVVDKSRLALGAIRNLRIAKIKGFRVDPQSGAILPATPAAEELWRLGLSNHEKFFVNKKTEVQLICEALELGPWQKDTYYLPLSRTESKLALERRKLWQRDLSQPVIGFNTGCASTIPAKKWTVEFHQQVIRKLQDLGFRNMVLLGGPEDRVRNQRIRSGLSEVSDSPTQEGLRDGLVSMEACDIVISGDSLGMHLAIAREKFVVAWFGPTCAHEIELYGRGVALHAKVPCSPCWKRSCDQSQMCYDQVDFDDIRRAVEQGVQWHLVNQSSTSKLHFLETSSSLSLVLSKSEDKAPMPPSILSVELE